MINLPREKIAFLLIIFCLFFGSFQVLAASADDILEQIQQLREQLDSLLSEYQQLAGEEGVHFKGCNISSFDENLEMGMSGEEIKCLQIILNSDPDTQLRASGVGSPGKETLYFGPLTRQAVIKFQNKYSEDILAPWGFRWGTGFVGPTTREKLNEFLASQPQEPQEEDPGEEEKETVAAKQLQVSLAEDNPSSTAIFSDGDHHNAGSQALVEFLKLDFSVPDGTHTKVSGLKFQRAGLSRDSDIANIYLYDGDEKLAEADSLSQREAVFSGSQPLFEVSDQKTITVKADLSRDAPEGNTIGFSLESSADITTEAKTVKGDLPLEGNLMSVVAVSDLGRLTISTSTNPSSVSPGTVDFNVMNFKLEAFNQDIEVFSLALDFTGSVPTSSVEDIELYKKEKLLASGALDSKGRVVFDLSSSPLKLVSGSPVNLSVEADIMGGSSKKVSFTIKEATDVVCKDTEYNVYIRPDTGVIGSFLGVESRPVKVTGGGLRVKLSDSSPVGSVALDAENIDIASYDVWALGEPVEVGSVNFKVTDASTSADLWDKLSAVRLFFAGEEIGSLDNIAEGEEYPVDTDFVVPLGETKTLKIKADISSPWGTENPIYNGEHLQAVLMKGDENAEAVDSGKRVDFISSPEMPANKLQVVAGAMAATKNPSVGPVTAVWEQENVLLASFVLTAGSEEPVEIQEIVLSDANQGDSTSSIASLGEAFTDLELYYGETQLGDTKTTETTDAAGTQYAFSLVPHLFLPQGASISLDLKGKVRENPHWEDGSVLLSEIGAVGRQTGRPVSLGASDEDKVKGQPIHLVQAGTLSVNVAPSSPSSQMVEMGAEEVTLGVWEFSADEIEDLKVTQVVVANAHAAGSKNVENLKMYCGDTKMTPTRPSLVMNSAGFGTVNEEDCLVPKGESKLFTLKGDIKGYQEGASAGDYLEFFINLPNEIVGAFSDAVIAQGSFNYALTEDPGTKAVSAVYPYHTVLSVGMECHQGCEDRARMLGDRMVDINLTGSSGDAQAEVNSITLQVSGALDEQAPGTSFYLRDEEDEVKATGSYQGNATSGKIVFTPSSPLFIGEETKAFQVTGDTRKLVAPNTSGHERVHVALYLGNPSTPGDISWSDQLVSGEINWVEHSKEVISVNLWY